MTELINRIAQDEALQEQIRACTDAKAFAVLLGLDEAQAEQIFPRVREIMESDTDLSDDVLKSISGGTGCGSGTSGNWGESPFFNPNKKN